MKKFFSYVLALTMLVSALTPSLAAEGPAEETPEAAVFSDISGHWAEDVIIKYYNMGAISGYTDGTFRPDGWVTKAEAATIIARVLESAGKELEPLDTEAAGRRGWYKTHDGVESPDIDADAWYFPYVEKAGSYLPTYNPSDMGVYLEVLGPYFNNPKSYFLPTAYVPRFHLAETLVEIKFYLDGLDETLDELRATATYLKDIYQDWPLASDSFIPPHLTTPNNWTRMRNYIWLAYKYNVMVGNPNGNFYPYDSVSRAQILVALDNILSGTE